MSKIKHIWPFSVLGHWRWFLLYIFIPVLKAKVRYAVTLKQLHKTANERKLKVLFVVGNTSKWKAQSLYDLMDNTNRFEPWILLTICDVEYEFNHQEKLSHIKRMRRFFDGRNMRCINGYTSDKQWIDLNEFHPDLVFYHQPWVVEPIQLPHHVAKTALTFYIPYYVPNYGDIVAESQTPFHRTLFCYVVLNRLWAEVYKHGLKHKMHACHFVSLGHTALDMYHKRDICTNDEIVIYAPHWSFNHPGNENFENYSTFLLTGEKMLSFAKTHTEVKWAFKPHPTLRHALERSGAWPKAKIDHYYDEWALIANTCFDGGYEELFFNSRAMITDCGSFLTEYACTGKPIIHLISSTAKIKPMKPSADLYATYYQAHDMNELDMMLDEIVLKKKDPNRDMRLKKVREAGLLDNYAAQNIMNYLDNLFR